MTAVFIILLREVEQCDVFYQVETFYMNVIRTFITINKTENFWHVLCIPRTCYKLSVLKNHVSTVHNIKNVNLKAYNELAVKVMSVFVHYKCVLHTYCCYY